MAKKFIAGAIKHPGALHRDLGVPQGQKIPAGKLAAAAKKGGKVGERARLAETLKSFKNDSAHGTTVAFTPSAKQARRNALKKNYGMR